MVMNVILLIEIIQLTNDPILIAFRKIFTDDMVGHAWDYYPPKGSPVSPGLDEAGSPLRNCPTDRRSDSTRRNE